MEPTDYAGRIDALGNAWEEFRAVNDRRLDEMEKRGSEDPLYLDQLGRISDALDSYKSRLDRIETAVARPMAGGEQASPYADEYKTAFCHYLRKGVDTALPLIARKALSVGSDPDGGYLVTPTISQKIINIVRETSPMRQIASVETISSDSLEILEDRDEMAAGWTTETGTIADTASAQFGKRSIPVFELYAQPKATQKLVDDAALDIEQWVADKVADIFSRKENTAFISGTGVGQPRGILTYAAGTSWGQIEQVNSGSSGAVTADGLHNLFYALKGEYAARATFLMARSVVLAVRLLKEATTNQYLWSPGLTAGASDTLLGAPVVQATDMQAVSANSLSIAVGDFSRAYQIVDRRDIRLLRDPYTDKPFVKFYTTKRVGGDVVNFEAIKIQKLA